LAYRPAGEGIGSEAQNPDPWAAMEERRVPFADLRHALEQAESCRSQPNGRWQVVGRDPDRDVLRLIVELHDELLVITVYRGDE